ncbi:MAG TPA: hypothetical protein VM791_18560, partial [Vicinamibacterales bacterium]|nr:hypothetical protein [Vicinamibacterales bacterium]
VHRGLGLLLRRDPQRGPGRLRPEAAPGLVPEAALAAVPRAAEPPWIAGAAQACSAVPPVRRCLLTTLRMKSSRTRW